MIVPVFQFEGGGSVSGWVAADLVGKVVPQFASLQAQFAKLPPTATVERRKLAERIEQEKDGRFIAPLFITTINGCFYFDHADLDADGSADIILRCEQLEGSYHYSVVSKQAGKWRGEQ